MASEKTHLVIEIMKLNNKLSDKKLFTLRNDTLYMILESLKNGIFLDHVKENGKRINICKNRFIL